MNNIEIGSTVVKGASVGIVIAADYTTGRYSVKWYDTEFGCWDKTTQEYRRALEVRRS